MRAMQTERFDALVIGAGMAGATAAAHLSATRRVALLEAEDSAGYHSTGRSAALWEPNWGNPDIRALTRAARGFLAAPPEGFTEVPLLLPRGALHLAPEEQLPALRDLLEKGAEFHALSIAEAQAMVPALRPGYAVAAAHEPGVMEIDVAALHQGFLRVLRRQGGALALRHRAGRLWKQNGLWHAETSGGAVHVAPILVNAAGAWGDEVAIAAGLRPLGLRPMRRTALIIDPAPWAVADWPLTGDVGASWYTRPEARGKLMLSPADETPDPPGDAQPDELDIAIAVDRLMTALDITVRRVEHSWAGLRSFLPDRSMAIGAAEEAGFFHMIGQGGYGIQTAPAQGRLLAALVNGEDPGELAPILPLLDPLRFQKVPA
ncbi:FAD dependent oxidoreductase [Pseudoroseomonas cervicalis ATCC 49957]|uniref:FAD dependent oxidoreductase n=2 Tax=Teichococcus cervicalis TaxID=204525 RepID=D5RLU8_9PROT|nr:FAD dependent oxidoreductase [Pseudoroseomonas cervicalis ATCC 49957]